MGFSVGGVARGALVIITAAAICACSSDDEHRTPVAEEQVRTNKQAILQTQSVTLSLPQAVDIRNLSIAALGTVIGGDRVDIRGLTTATSNASSKVQINANAKTRSIVSKGNVVIGSGTHVTGDVTASGTISAPAGSVSGTRSPLTDLGTPQQIQWEYSVETTNLGPITANVGQALDLVPGTYGNLTLNSGGSVTLHTGAYVFGAISINAASKLLIDSTSGPVQVHSAQAFNFMGKVESANIGAPHLLVRLSGTAQVNIQSSFTGVLLAPNANVSLQAAQPNGHTGMFFGKNVTLQPDTIVHPYDFAWGSLVPSLEPKLSSDFPVHMMPRGPLSVPLDVAPDPLGAPVSRGSDSPTPLKFRLHASYPVSGGAIGNGSVTFRFRNGASGPLVTCIYQGGFSGALPGNQLEWGAARMLNLQSCSDGLPPSEDREATHFELTVDPAEGIPVTVRAPTTQDRSCSDQMLLLTPQQTTEMHDTFDWSTKQKIAANNSNGTPALYYAWLYLRTKDDVINARKLRIHVLSSPLFQQELDQFAGKCGTFTNPGDGSGAFVPAIIPGATYNRLIDALTADGLSGNRKVFEAIILRTPPSDAIEPNGSIRYDVLANSGFKYLDYESRPLRPQSEITQYSSAVAAVVDVIQWVGDVVDGVVQGIETGLAVVQKLFTGTVRVRMHVNAINGDRSFGSNNPLLIRGWGERAGQGLGAQGLPVSIIQRFAGWPIPARSNGTTDAAGFVSIAAIKGENSLGSGLCLTLQTASTKLGEWLWADEFCDFRGFDANVSNSLENFRLDDLDSSTPPETPLSIRIDHNHLSTFYQVEDVMEWSRKVLHVTPERADIMVGFWANTFASRRNDGTRRPWTDCLESYGTVKEDLIEATLTTGMLASALIPVGGTAFGPTIVASTVAMEIFGNHDLAVPDSSAVEVSREKMSHEAGHFIYCALLDRALGAPAVDDVIWDAMVNGEGRTRPKYYINEAVAEFVSMQVTGGIDYNWLAAEDDAGVEQNFPATSWAKDYHYRSGIFCNGNVIEDDDETDDDDQCVDMNFTALNGAKPNEGMARLATLIQDAFDGREDITRNSMNSADHWRLESGVLVPNLGESRVPYGDQDGTREHVALGPAQFVSLIEHFALNNDEIDDEIVFYAVNRVMIEGGETSWCRRCPVLALHSPVRTAEAEFDIGKLFSTCVTDPMVAGALEQEPPEPDGRLDAATCTPCPPGHYSNGDGVCEECTGTLVGNTCVACDVDRVENGDTVPQTLVLDPTDQASTDSCSEMYWLRLDNPAGVFARGATDFTVTSGPETLNQQACERLYELHIGHLDDNGVPDADISLASTGQYTTCGPDVEICFSQCINLPSKEFTGADVTGLSSILFGIPVDGTKRLTFSVDGILAPPQ